MNGSSCDLGILLERQQRAFLADLSPSRRAREDRLRRLDRLVETHAERFAQAISEDFGTRSSIEVRITETMLLRAGVRHALHHLRAWMKPRRAPVALAYRPGRARLICQPRGVVGIISPWNYPLQLSLAPLIGALAAGNRAMIKPSESTPAFAAALEAAVGETFAADEAAVVTGDAALGRMFAALPFDHLLFTGSTAVGREVALAAAKNLTPVTLELSGKSPVIVDASCALDGIVERIAWGKLINAGQTCIAPDYALVPRAGADRFARALCASMHRLYPTFRGNPDYTSIVSERHIDRLRDLVEDARARGARVIELEDGGAQQGGHRRQLAPSLLLDVDEDMRVMREEIFGPILPIVAYDTLDDAMAFVNARARPLALYWFGADRKARDRVLAGTIAGGVTINDTLAHVAQDSLPFGGIGDSGYGHYHGEYGFRQFSAQKPVFVQARLSGLGLIRPPYRSSIGRLLDWISYLT